MFKLFSFLNGGIPKSPKASTLKPTVLLILDGYGIAPNSEGNAIARANRPNLASYPKNYPHGELIASGESVGLPANEVGNTEVGHLTLGAGRVIDQDLVRINKSIKDMSFFDNKSLIDALNHIKDKPHYKFHIAGLVGTGNVHSSLSHFWALIDFCKRNRLTDVCLHLFLDGRDSPTQEGISIVEKIDAEMKNSKIGRISTIAGRYYAMDRDGRWDRIKLAYEAMVLGRGKLAKNAVEAVKRSYDEGKTDEFVEPVVMTDDSGKPVGLVDDGDSFVFFNFRIDRPRQLTMSFVMPDFENIREFDFGKDPEREGRKEGKVHFVGGTFKREKVVKNLYFVTMTEYQENLPVNGIAFPKIVVNETLSEIISRQKLFQMHMSESEKERFVTYYFNGQKEGKFFGEESVIVPSPQVATYDLKPEMSADKLVQEYKRRSNEGKYSFFVINFANADMVGHTGNLAAAIRAVEHLDKAVSEVINWTMGLGGTVLITADHGNAEELLTYPSTSFFITTEKGKASTDHSNNPVPIIIISEAFKGKALDLGRGALADVAPTILHIMNIKKPIAMTGRSLLDKLVG